MIDQLLRQIEAQIRRGQWLAVEALCQQVLEFNPHHAASWHHLSIAQFVQGRRRDAEDSSRRAIAENASQSAFWLHLGNILFQDEQFTDAAAAYRQSLALDPRDPTAWNNLGSSEHVQKHTAEARAAYEASLSLMPTQWETRLKLSLLLDGEWSLTEAESHAARIVTDDPMRAEGWTMLGRIRLAQGRQAEALDALARSASLMPIAASHSRLLQCRQYTDDVTAEGLLDAHKSWGNTFAQNLPPLVTRPRRANTSQQPLRLGFVSGEFGKSPIGHLALPLLEHLDKSQCTIACYFDHRAEDELTARFRAASNTWHVSHGQSDESLAEQIVRDEIDVLVDLMGHLGNRLLVHARRPAPLQITWLGYVGTTGLEAIDCLLADPFHVRPGEEIHYVETVLRMPHGYICYGPPLEAPPVGPLPAATSGRITFGCFNNPSKYSPRSLDAFSHVLRRVPNCRLLLKYGGLHEPASQNRLRAEFAKRGIEPERIQLEGWSPHTELLAAYNRVDLALDTQPYSGGLTTCEALWMGVPTVTYPGATFAGRHCTSHLSNACYEQFVATDAAEYIELAVNWANRLDELAAIRRTMREQVRASHLCNAAEFANDFLALLRGVTFQT